MDAVITAADFLRMTEAIRRHVPAAAWKFDSRLNLFTLSMLADKQEDGSYSIHVVRWPR